MIDWFNFIKQKAAQKFLKKSSARGSDSNLASVSQQGSFIDQIPDLMSFSWAALRTFLADDSH